MIKTLKASLDKASAPNASTSDIENAFLDLVFLNRLEKYNDVEARVIFSALGAEIKAFLDTPVFLRSLRDNNLLSIAQDLNNFYSAIFKVRFGEIQDQI
ncbi:MAG: hypothetical protein K2I74_02525 [Treponemataceae bacterium]|nr:hypothetical protein [Treponemataceae bacterium]